MPGRCVVGGCSAFPDVQNGLILHAVPFLKWRTSRSKETPKEVDRFRETKESQVGADPKLVSLLKALYWKRLCSPLQLRRRSDQEADHAKAETRRNWHKRCAICSCQSSHQKTSRQWKCETSSRTRGKICQMFRGTSWFICTAKTKASEIIIFIFNLEIL